MAAASTVAAFTAADSEPAVLPFTAEAIVTAASIDFIMAATATPTGPTSTGIITSIGGSTTHRRIIIQTTIIRTATAGPSGPIMDRAGSAAFGRGGTVTTGIGEPNSWMRNETGAREGARCPCVMSDGLIPVLELPGLHF